jgi:hypothetical protein
LASRILFRLLQSCDFAREFNISLMLFGKLFGDGLVALVVGFDDAQIGSVR